MGPREPIYNRRNWFRTNCQQQTNLNMKGEEKKNKKDYDIKMRKLIENRFNLLMDLI